MKRLGAVATILAASGCAVLLAIDGDYAVGNTRDASPGDAGGDGDAGAREGGTGFCATYDSSAAELFCDDFDEGNPLGSGWSYSYAPDGAAMGLDFDAAVSPPASVQIVTQPAGAFVFLGRTSSIPLTERVAVQADIRVDDYADASFETFSVLDISATSSSGYQSAYLYVGPQGARVWEAFSKPDGGGYAQTGTGLTEFLIRDVWTRVRLEIDPVAQTLTFFLDGKAVDKHPLAYPWPVGATVDVAAGSHWAALDGDGGFLLVGRRRFHVDNAVMEVK